MNSRERAILVFLIAVLLVGVAVNVFKHNRLQARMRVIEIAHSARADSETLTPSPSPNGRGVGYEGAKLDINSATATELDLLPGIGPALARRIFDYRTSNGPFKTGEDLLKVPGIGPKKLAAIRDRIAVSPSPDSR